MKNLKTNISVILCTLFLISSLIPTSFASQDSLDKYLLSAGDILRISVFSVDELSGDFRIDEAGFITMPLIGEVKAQNLDKYRLNLLITSKLIEGNYYNDPKVTVEIIALKPFYILGEIKTPGSYEYRPDLDIFKAIAIAGGYTPRAQKNNIIIIRNIDGNKTHIRATEETTVLPGDSIKVKQRFF